MKKTRRFFRGNGSVFCGLIIILLLEFLVTGCGPSLSGPKAVREFEKAGPVMTVGPEVEDGQVQPAAGSYRVVAGDILELQMPAVLRVVSSDLREWFKPSYGSAGGEPYVARINEEGFIILPIIGQIDVGGKTVAEIESTVTKSYYPRYVVNPPMVVCEVRKYNNENERVFAVMGLVRKASSFPYPPDVQYNLDEALSFAGGLDMVADPRYVTVYRMNEKGQIVSATFSAEDKAFADGSQVVIKPGDIVYVDHTFRTRTNKFLAEVFDITFGADFHSYGSN